MYERKSSSELLRSQQITAKRPLGGVALEATNGHIDTSNVDAAEVTLNVLGGDDLPALDANPREYPSVTLQIQYKDQSGRVVDLTHEMSGNTFAALCKWSTIPEPLPLVDKDTLTNGALKSREKEEADHRQVKKNVLEGIRTCAETLLRDGLVGVDDYTRRKIIEQLISNVQESPYTARIMNQERKPRSIDI
jgi:hypothetical protein